MAKRKAATTRKTMGARKTTSKRRTAAKRELIDTGTDKRYVWLMFAERYLTRRLFGAILQRIWVLAVPAG